MPAAVSLLATSHSNESLLTLTVDIADRCFSLAKADESTSLRHKYEQGSLTDAINQYQDNSIRLYPPPYHPAIPPHLA